MKWTSKHFLLYGALLLSLLCYYLIAFYTTRANYGQLFSLIALIFIGYFIIYKYHKANLSAKFWLVAAISFRCVFLFSTPTLSDDYFRFAWDGNGILQTVNPYELTPQSIAQQKTLSAEENHLLLHMNSPNYYSVYPPILQIAFASTSYFSQNLASFVLILKLIILLFEIITLILLYQLLLLLHLPPQRWLLYAFNPLIIIELIGNLHFEALMITGLVATFYYLLKNKNTLAALCFSFAVGVKLLPLMLLPLLWKKLGLKNGCIFTSIVGISLVVMFVPFLNFDLLHNFNESLHLYFQTFEFNASIYYFMRWIGFQWKGYNMIAIIGATNALFSLGLILYVSLKRQETWHHTITQTLIIFGIYFAFASIVHPWYIAILVLLSLFTTYRFALVWSALIFLSYFTYRDATYTENMWLVFVEYAIVIAVFIYEVYWKKDKIKNLRKQ